MEVATKEEYLKIHYGNRKDYFRLNEDDIKPMKFSIGDIIHTIDLHCLEDEYGNDINQDITFVNPNLITGEYKITGFVDDEPDDYYCISLKDCFGQSGIDTYVSRNSIFENYKNSHLM